MVSNKNCETSVRKLPKNIFNVFNNHKFIALLDRDDNFWEPLYQSIVFPFKSFSSLIFSLSHTHTLTHSFFLY